jgi:uncharacterized protein YjbI with pentapeptide repeats
VGVVAPTVIGAYLRGANLSGAFLTDANLSGANLSTADLSGAKNLTQGQLDQACGNAAKKCLRALYPDLVLR